MNIFSFFLNISKFNPLVNQKMQSFIQNLLKNVAFPFEHKEVKNSIFVHTHTNTNTLYFNLFNNQAKK